MWGRWLLASCLLLGRAGGAEQAADLPRRVSSLVRQLNDDQLRRRGEAEAALIELGPDALDLLPPLDERLPAEVKLRLGRVVKSLQTAAAEAVLRGSRVTLSGTMPLREAMKAIEQQTGNRMAPLGEWGGTSVRADFHGTSYWEAVDRLLDQAGLTLTPYSGALGAWGVTVRPEGQRLRSEGAVYCGLFRLAPVRIEGVRDLRNPAVKGLSVRLEISWEPRITPISLDQPLSRVAARDDRGRIIPVDGVEGVRSAAPRRDLPLVELDLPLQLPDRAARRIASLQGELTAMLPGRVETFRFSQLESARDVQRERAGVAVTLEQFRKNRDVYEARVGVRFADAGAALESHRGWIYDNEAYLLDSNGKRRENVGGETTWRRPDGAGFSYKFVLDGSPAGYTFVYVTPALIREVHVKYQLRDIELP